MPLWIGPFKIVKKIEETAYELELAANMRMHDVFHVSLLKPYNPAKHKVVAIPPTLTIGEQQEFEVQSILGERTRKIKHPRRGQATILREYLVSWRGQDYYANTWEPEKNLKNARAKIQEYVENKHKA